MSRKYFKKFAIMLPNKNVEEIQKSFLDNRKIFENANINLDLDIVQFIQFGEEKVYGIEGVIFEDTFNESRAKYTLLKKSLKFIFGDIREKMTMQGYRD